MDIEAVGRRLRPAMNLGWVPLLGLAVLLVAGAPATAAAHSQPPGREVLRLQGYSGTRPPGFAGTEVALEALGRAHAFYAVEHQRIALEAPADTALPDRLVLQGPRQVLARFAAARPEQRVTIVGEWRPGRSDLFVVALDLCPE